MELESRNAEPRGRYVPMPSVSLDRFSVSLRVAEIVSHPDRSSDGWPYTEAGILRRPCRSTSARHSFPADGVCRGRTRLEDVPALSSRPELASKLRPVSHTGGSRLLQRLEVTGSLSFGGGFAELLKPGLLASLIVQVEKTITTSQYPCKMRNSWVTKYLRQDLPARITFTLVARMSLGPLHPVSKND